TAPRWAVPARRAAEVHGMKLPLLLLYGRADSTISFMGANIYPQDVENGLYGDRERVAQLASFTLSLEAVDGDETRQQPVIHLELREGVELEDGARAAFAASAREGAIAYLAKTSRDFAKPAIVIVNAPAASSRIDERRQTIHRVCQLTGQLAGPVSASKAAGKRTNPRNEGS
ncbi:MAG: hypothetical protein ACR2JK_03485, partial [Geodermatophilaceae bacterium]